MNMLHKGIEIKVCIRKFTINNIVYKCEKLKEPNIQSYNETDSSELTIKYFPQYIVKWKKEN